MDHAQISKLNEEIKFFNNNGHIQGHETIFPICKWIDKNNLKFVGTAFFVSENIFMTAKHVLLDNPDKVTEGIFAFTFNSQQQYFSRSISNVIVHEIADVAVGVLRPLEHKKTKKRFINKWLTLDTKPCKISDPVATYAYPLTKIENKNGATSAKFNTNFESGVITTVFPNGRDSFLLPGPCYETSMLILGGASGGPVFNKEGLVIGINSTGIDGLDNPVSYVSMIHQALSLKLPNVKIPKSNKSNISLLELAKYGYLSVK